MEMEKFGATHVLLVGKSRYKVKIVGVVGEKYNVIFSPHGTVCCEGIHYIRDVSLDQLKEIK